MMIQIPNPSLNLSLNLKDLNVMKRIMLKRPLMTLKITMGAMMLKIQDVCPYCHGTSLKSLKMERMF